MVVVVAIEVVAEERLQWFAMQPAWLLKPPVSGLQGQWRAAGELVE